MNEPSFTPSVILAAADHDRIQEVCDTFEDAWQSGQTPTLEDYLVPMVPETRRHLLYRLLRLEIEYRRKRRRPPTRAELLARFPRDSAVVHAAFDATRDESLYRIGRYEIYEEIARGGMGMVLRGRDPAMDRELAFKVILDCHRGNPQVVRRFTDEARITGQLQHPGIPPIHELGRTDEGLPYYSMKLIQGRTLAAMLKERNGPVDELPKFLQIFHQVCQTIAYAHTQGIIHRDLKPANIMVGAFGEVQVMDWGLAKRLEEAQAAAVTPSSKPRVNPSLALAETWTGASPLEGSVTPHADAGLTQHGQAIGTLPYMPPEQARGELERVNERADVFALGSILCEILTGEPAYRRSGDWRLLWNDVIEGELLDAYSRLHLCWAGPELRELAQACLSAAPEKRPAAGQEVARRVKSHLERMEEAARDAEVQKAVREAQTMKRRAAWTTAAVVAFFVAAGVGASLYIVQSNPALFGPPRDTAVIAPRRARPGAAPLAPGPQLISPAAGATLENGARDESQELAWRFEWSETSGAARYHLQIRGPLATAPVVDDDALTAPEFVYRQAGYIRGNFTRAWRWKVRAQVDGVWTAWSEQRMFHVAPADAGRMLTPAADLELVQAERQFGHQAPVTCVAFTPDGKRIISGGWDHKLRLWSVATGDLIRPLGGHSDKIWCLAVSPWNSRWALSGGQDSRVILWDLETGIVHEFAGHDKSSTVSGVAFLPDGKHAISTGWDRTLRVWSLIDGRQVRVFPTKTESGEFAVLHTPCVFGDRAVCGSSGSNLYVVDLNSERMEQELATHHERLERLALTSDSRFAASSGAGGILRLTDLSTGISKPPLLTGDWTWSTAFACDGKRVLFTTGGERSGRDFAPTKDHFIHLCDPDAATVTHRFVGHTHIVFALAVSPNGTHFASASFDGTVRLWRLPAAE